MSKDIPDYMRGFDLNDDWGIAGTAAEAPKSPTIDTSKIASTDELKDLKKDVSSIKSAMNEIFQIVAEKETITKELTSEETNKRFKLLLKKGQTGLSVAYDMPTLMGYDPGHNLSLGEVGKCGVNVFHIGDMERLFDGINLGDVSVSQTINGPAIILLAFYIAVAEKQGVELSTLKGTLQNDILKEFIAQKEWIFPPEPSMRLITDMLSFCTKNLPLYNTISVSGYHIREAGSTAAQELAFTLSDGFTYIEHGIEAGLDVDSFAPRISFFFNSHSDFFEEIAKYRAARRIWAKRLKNKYGAKNKKSMMLRFHTQTAGCSLTAQQPEINIARTSFQAMAAVLGAVSYTHLTLPTILLV